MKGCLRVMVVLAVLALCAGSALAERTLGFPYCEYLGFSDYWYEYKVTCYTDDLYPFGRLIVKAEVANIAPYYPWAGNGPQDTSIPNPNRGGGEWIWNFAITRRQVNPVPKDNAMWTASTLDDVVADHTAWEGYFYLYVPNSQPTGGIAVTMDGGPVSAEEHTVEVPGPAVIPEPGSMLALGGLFGGLLPFLRRRK